MRPCELRTLDAWRDEYYLEWSGSAIVLQLCCWREFSPLNNQLGRNKLHLIRSPVTEPFLPRPFWNDGGPLIIVPQAAVPVWEGTDPPTGGRVVDARSRWSGAAIASDYDRACDIDPESACALDVGRDWAVVLGTVAARSAQWLPGADGRTFFAVGIEAADNTAPERLLALASESGEWRVLLERAAVGADGLLLAHAASRLTEVQELSAMMRASEGEAAGAVIGDGLRYPAFSGVYSVNARDIITPEGEYLTFVRFSPIVAAA
jgi:Immunity protein 21